LLTEYGKAASTNVLLRTSRRAFFCHGIGVFGRRMTSRFSGNVTLMGTMLVRFGRERCCTSPRI
jgi:hypothetical protein